MNESIRKQDPIIHVSSPLLSRSRCFHASTSSDSHRFLGLLSFYVWRSLSRLPGTHTCPDVGYTNSENSTKNTSERINSERTANEPIRKLPPEHRTFGENPDAQVSGFF